MAYVFIVVDDDKKKSALKEYRGKSGICTLISLFVPTYTWDVYSWALAFAFLKTEK